MKDVSKFSASPMLPGRDEETRKVAEVFSRVKSLGQAELVVAIGTPGAGKSRWISNLETSLEIKTGKWLRASAGEASDPAAVAATWLRARLSLSPGPQVAEGLKAALAHLELGTEPEVTELAGHLGYYLGLQPQGSVDASSSASLRRRALKRWLELDSQKAPLVLLLEEGHLASPETLTMIESLAASLESAKVLFLIEARPEFETKHPTFPSSLTRSRATKIELAPLGTADIDRLLNERFPGVSLTVAQRTGILDFVHARSSGNAYLVERLLDVIAAELKAAPSLDPDRLSELTIPTSLENAAEQRVNQLSTHEREILEMAAIMGQNFWLGALVSLGRISRRAPALWGGLEDLGVQYKDILRSLSERDYVVQEATSLPGESQYRFCHNVEHGVVYRGVTDSEAKQFHLRFAEWLECRVGTTGFEFDEFVAQHYAKGGAHRRAGEFYLRAGDRARESFLNAKAVACYERGLELIGDENVGRKLETLHNFGDVLQLVGRYEDAIAKFRSLLELAYRLDLKSKGGVAHNRIGRVYRAVGKLDDAMRHLGTALALFEAASDQRGVAASLDDIGKVHWLRGAYPMAEQFVSKGLELRRRLGERRSVALSLNNLGLVCFDSSRHEEARNAFDEALAIRREISDEPGVAQTLNNLGSIYQERGETALAVECWREALSIMERIGDRMHQAVVMTNLGEALHRRGDGPAAIAILEQAEAISASLGDRILEGEVLRGLARAHLLVGESDKARDFVAKSIRLFEQAASKPFLGLAIRTAAEVSIALSAYEAAQTQFAQATKIFEQLGSDSELARTLKSYADFLDLPSSPKQDPKEAKRLRARANKLEEQLGVSLQGR